MRLLHLLLLGIVGTTGAIPTPNIARDTTIRDTEVEQDTSATNDHSRWAGATGVVAEYKSSESTMDLGVEKNTNAIKPTKPVKLTTNQIFKMDKNLTGPWSTPLINTGKTVAANRTKDDITPSIIENSAVPVTQQHNSIPFAPDDTIDEMMVTSPESGTDLSIASDVMEYDNTDNQYGKTNVDGSTDNNTIPDVMVSDYIGSHNETTRISSNKTAQDVSSTPGPETTSWSQKEEVVTVFRNGTDLTATPYVKKDDNGNKNETTQNPATQEDAVLVSRSGTDPNYQDQNGTTDIVASDASVTQEDVVTISETDIKLTPDVVDFDEPEQEDVRDNIPDTIMRPHEIRPDDFDDLDYGYQASQAAVVLFGAWPILIYFRMQ